MAKLPYVSREELPVGRRGVYDRIMETRGNVANIFGLLLNSPDAAEVATNVGEFVRFKSPLDPVVREITILSVARETNAGYEWAQHEPIALKDGVSERTIEAIRSGRAPMGVPAKEGVYAQAVKELVRDGKMSDLTFQAVEHLLGPAQTIDFLVLVGYYWMLGRIMATLEIDLDEGLESNLPEV